MIRTVVHAFFVRYWSMRIYWVISNTPAKCEDDQINGCQENQRTYIHTCIHTWQEYSYTPLGFKYSLEALRWLWRVIKFVACFFFHCESFIKSPLRLGIGLPNTIYACHSQTQTAHMWISVKAKAAAKLQSRISCISFFICLWQDGIGHVKYFAYSFTMHHHLKVVNKVMPLV